MVRVLVRLLNGVDHQQRGVHRTYRLFARRDVCRRVQGGVWMEAPCCFPQYSANAIRSPTASKSPIRVTNGRQRLVMWTTLAFSCSLSKTFRQSG